MGVGVSRSGVLVSGCELGVGFSGWGVNGCVSPC